MSKLVPDIAIRAEALAELAGTDFEAAVAERDAASASTERDLLDLALTVGVLLSFAAQASSYVTTKSRPWPGTGYDRAADDPHVLWGFGRFLSAVRAVEELFAEAVSSVAGNRPDATERIAVAQVFAFDAGAPGISDTIGLLGASSVSEKHGFDRLWRDFHRAALVRGNDTATILGRRIVTAAHARH